LISEKKLSVSCMAALVLIAGLGLLSDRVQQTAMDQDRGLGGVINESGRQRMLTQMISSLATQYWLGDASARSELETAMATMQAGHKALSDPYRADVAQPGVAQELHKIYFVGPDSLDAQVGKYLAEAEQVASAGSQDSSQAALHAIQAQARGSLREGLNEVVLIHQRESEANIQMLKKLVWALYVLMVGVLVLLWFFLFQPMVRQIGRQSLVED